MASSPTFEWKTESTKTFEKKTLGQTLDLWCPELWIWISSGSSVRPDPIRQAQRDRRPEQPRTVPARARTSQNHRATPIPETRAARSSCGNDPMTAATCSWPNLLHRKSWASDPTPPRTRQWAEWTQPWLQLMPSRREASLWRHSLSSWATRTARRSSRRCRRLRRPKKTFPENLLRREECRASASSWTTPSCSS